MKKFYNNTLIGGAFSKALRVVALLCVLLGFSSSAWGTTYYLWYNAKSNEPNYKDGNFTMSAGATLTNNKCVWTISNLRKDNSYFYISTSSTYSESNLKSVNIQTNNPNDAVVNATGKQEYSGKVGFYVSCKTAGSTVTITIDFSSNSQYVVSPVGGGAAAACTPSATITGATYSNGSINLSGRLSQVCDSKTTYYGWQYKTSANGNWEGAITGAANNSSKVAIDYSKSWDNGGNLVAGTTYYFRAYATYDAETWYSDNKILSVTIPNGAGSTGEADCSGIIYLKPGVWEHTDGQRYAAYFFNGTSSDVWVDMVATTSGGECAGLYYVETPDGGYQNVLFGRMNPDRSDNSFTHKDNGGPMYNQTENCTLTEGKNLYSITGWSDGDDSKSGVGTPTKSNCTDGCTPAEQPSTNVLLSREAIVNKSAKTAQLFGYLKSIKAPDCPTSAITNYGFFYCMVNDGDAPCTPTSTSTPIAADPSDALSRGEEFTATVGLIKEPSDALQDGKTYYYRAYAEIDGKFILSGETRSFSTDPCIPQYGGLSDKYVNGTPIVYTINADPAFAANDCKLHFNSLQAAIDHLKDTNEKDNDFKYVTLSDGSYNLNQPVEMRVVYYDDTPDDDEKAYAYRGTTDYGMTAGNVTPTNVNLIKDINKTASNSANTLTIKAGTSKAKPWIHHIVIRNSKNIVLDSLCIYSDPTGIKDNALEIDVNSTSWPNIQPNFENANIVIQNSIIGSAGFTGVHVSGYDGITFKGNEIEASFAADDSQRKNTLNWGASAKFVACKNIKFIQNNFRGSQPTLLWIQDSQNALFMNNVFWNTNTFLANTGEVTPTAIKLVNQYGRDINKIGIFYNTFFFADNGKSSSSKYNFFTEYLAASDGSTTGTQYFKEHIYFQYNNCYSYDTDCPGKDAFVGKGSGDGDNVSFSVVSESSNNANFCPNNFWSKYDLDNNKTKSVFAFSECANTFTNVKSQVCETSASGPASLIVKGSAMNTGDKLSVDDIATKTGIELTDKESTSDRYLIGVRPNDNTWTMGAYQSKDNIDTKVIYWVGISSDWDDRNNWEYETEVDGKMVRQRVSCVNNFSEDLKVVIEEIGTVEVAGGRSWPKVPASFDANYRKENSNAKVPVGEQVSITGKYASTIELEYGAGLRGVENLKDSEGNVLYDNAIVHFDADRSKWLLVGNVIKPWDEKNKQYRSSVSGDYYLNHVPQVYMHKAELNGSDVVWNKTFADLEIPVPSDEVYAINVTGYYGTSWYPVKSYNKRYGTNYSDTEPQPYVFTGRFAITEETEGGNNFVYPSWNAKNLFNNVYPCNLNASLIDETIGSVSIYDYEYGSFKPLDQIGNRADVLIRSQNGFVIENNKEQSDFEITMDLLAGGSTRTRSTAVELPTFSLLVDNANTTAPGASNVIVRLDENQDVGYQSPFNTSKVFTQNENTPEAYLLSNDAMYSRLYVGKDVKRIPLGIRLRKGMNITFKQVYSEGFDKVILLDTHTGKEYNLLRRSYTTEMLQGTVEGRFYLLFTIEEQDDNQDDDFTTDIEDALTEQASINIYAVSNSTVRVLGNNTELQKIYVSDMAGRTMRYDASGNFAELQLPVSQGVYLVQVIGDNVTRTEKVILK